MADRLADEHELDSEIERLTQAQMHRDAQMHQEIRAAKQLRSEHSELQDSAASLEQQLEESKGSASEMERELVETRRSSAEKSLCVEQMMTELRASEAQILELEKDLEHKHTDLLTVQCSGGVLLKLFVDARLGKARTGGTATG